MNFQEGTPLVCACEKGRLEDVRVLVEGHDEMEKTGMSVDEMVSKEGKSSDGWTLCTPLQMAAINEQLEIVQYLVKTCTTVDLVLIGQTNSKYVQLNFQARLHWSTLCCTVDDQRRMFKRSNEQLEISSTITMETSKRHHQSSE